MSSRPPLLPLVVATLLLAWGALVLSSVAVQHGWPNALVKIGLGLALVGPGLVASVLLDRQYGSWAVVEFWQRLCMWPFRRRWYLIVLALPGAIAVAAVAIASLSGSARSAVTWQELITELGSIGPIGLLGTFGVAFGLAVGQELGWRGYALPILQANRCALVASLVVGLLWAAWRLPLELARHSDSDLTSTGLFLANTVALSVLVTWIYNNTFGSLLAVSLFASMQTVVATVLPGVTAYDNHTGALALLVVRCLVVTLVIALAGPRYLSRRDPRDHPYLDCPVTGT